MGKRREGLIGVGRQTGGHHARWRLIYACFIWAMAEALMGIFKLDRRAYLLQADWAEKS